MADKNDLMKSLVAEGMFQALGQERREALVREALAGLVAPQKRGYGEGPSLLEEAYRTEATSIMSGLVREAMADPAVRERMREVVTSGLDKFFSGTNIADRLAELVWKLFDQGTRS